ncbi:MAG: universal stress protein [Solirubrobacterales bacterium]|nr:universal stress protein [Solirubrobacterales bacterium]
MTSNAPGQKKAFMRRVQRESHGSQALPSGGLTRRAAPRLIGVGVNGGSSGRDAVALATMLGRPSGAELLLIAAHQEPLLPIVPPAGTSWKSQQGAAWQMLAETRDSLAPEALIAVQADVLMWRALRHVVRQEHRDLLVVGSGRGAAPGHVRLGADASDLLDHLACPLAIAPCGMAKRERAGLARVTVGFDGEPESLAALELAASLATAAGAELYVQGVIDDHDRGGRATEELLLAEDGLADDRVSSLLERADAAVRDNETTAIVDVVDGCPAAVLSALGDRVDLLVIGSGHSAPAGRVALGRTGTSLMDDAPYPILVVPRP